MLTEKQKKEIRSYFLDVFPDGISGTSLKPGDIFDEYVVQDIIESRYPEHRFKDVIFTAIKNSEKDQNDDIFLEVNDFWESNKEEYRNDFHEILAYVRSFIKVDTTTLIEDCRDYAVDMDIFIDTGDGKFGFSSNSMYPHIDAEKDVSCDEIADRKPSLFFLTESQGYSKEQLHSFLLSSTDESTCKKDGFLPSVFQELINMNAPCPQLVFLRKMRLSMVLDILKGQRTGVKTTVVMPSNTTCGLYDRKEGAGSLMGIQLEKDLHIPAEHIILCPSGTYPDSIHDFYGFDDEYFYLPKPE